MLLRKLENVAIGTRMELRETYVFNQPYTQGHTTIMVNLSKYYTFARHGDHIRVK